MVRRTLKREESFAIHPLYMMGSPNTEGYQGEDTAMGDAITGFISADGMPTPMSQLPYVQSSDGASIAMSFQSEDGGSTSTVMQQTRQDAERFRRSAVPTPQDSGLKIVGARVQVLVKAINDFREFGVDHVVQLPELVLVGDQSAGKSSLMGALAEIHLPQSSGCCTRCPAHITTEPAAEWKCEIALHQNYSYEPTNRPIEPKHVTKGNPFPPWREQHLVTKPFKTIYRKNELEKVLRWAQVATLNHNTDHSRYIPGSSTFANDESIDAKFSPNVVSVKISGPGLPSLSFYDLPGIFQNPGQKADEYLVKVIENLAKKYIEHPQALIICALPMSADPATSRTGKVIADCRAESRCIGVLTKADRLQVGQSHADFERILMAEEHQVGHGYFVTKQPGHGSLIYDAQYHAKARADENDFFDTQEPWVGEWNQFRNRCGTTNLQHALSQKFAVQILHNIPIITKKINARADTIEAELQKLPELPTENVYHAVSRKLFDFAHDAGDMFTRDDYKKSFLNSWSRLSERFRDAIVDMKPSIKVAHESDTAVPELISIDDTDDMDDAQSPANGKRRLEEQGTPTPAPKIRKGPNDAAIRPGHNGILGVNGHRHETPGSEKNAGLPNRQAPATTPQPQPPGEDRNATPNPFEDFLGHGKGFSSLSEIRQKIMEYKRAGLPAHVSPRVQDELCMRSVKPWDQPLDRFLDLTFASLREAAGLILDTHLSQWKQTQLYKEAHQHLASFFDNLEVIQRERAAELFDLETYKLFTFNDAAFKHHYAKELETLEHNRHLRRARVYVRKQEQMGFKYRDAVAKGNAERAVKREQLGEDPFQEEIKVAAFVRGYYLTAGLRFVDHICLSIGSKLFKDAQNDIRDYLHYQLGILQGGEERCRELMEENAFVAKKRQDFKQEKESLKRFTDRLLQLAEENKALDDHEMS